MKRILSLSLALLALCLTGVRASAPQDNPLLMPSDAPYGAPRFDLVRPAHFAQAFAVAMDSSRAERSAILSIPASRATFLNTIAPLDNDGQFYASVSAVFGVLKNCMNTAEVSAVAHELTSALSRFEDDMSLDTAAFARVAGLYARRDALGLDSLQMRTLERNYRNYVRAGALCAPTQVDSLRAINERMAAARLLHGEHIVACTDNFILLVGDKDSLAGLSPAVLRAAAAAATKAGHPGQWGFTFDRSLYGAVMQSADNRDLRRRLYTAYLSRCAGDGPYDNRALSIEIANLRLQRARLLGYRNYADYAIEVNMAPSADAVRSLLMQLATPATDKARDELAVVEIFARLSEGQDFELQGWDWSYYSTRYRRGKFDTAATSLRPYQSLENVLKGVFWTAGKLYGIRVILREDVPAWHPDVMVFEVLEADDTPLGLLYIDPYARPAKRGGAWCSTIRRYGIKDGVETLPLVTINYNFTKAPDGAPTLLTTAEVKTSFHEFGHALANFFSRGPYPSVSGRFPRDMVELPSQVLEHWGRSPEVIRTFARHHATGEAPPEALLQPNRAAELYGEGRATSEHMAAALLDLEWHSLTEAYTGTVEDFERDFARRYGFIDVPRYRTTYFNHIFAGGYASQYYVYTWASVLDTDAFAAFTETGDIFDPGVAARFRKYILTGVSWDEPMKQYERFRGSTPAVEPLLRRKGFIP